MKTAHSLFVKATAALRVCTVADDVAYHDISRRGGSGSGSGIGSELTKNIFKRT
jgi:hypothetical protein